MSADQMDKAEAKRQAEIAQHIADGTTPGYGTASGDEYCYPCRRYHGPRDHVLTCRQCGEYVRGLEITAHMADHDSDPAIRPQPELTAERIAHLLAGLRTERSSLRARIPAGSSLRPELQARLANVEVRIAELEE
jgi:hypothetical protein